jgi:hypothetical protein
MELTARTLEAAMRTTLEAKVRVLGKVLAAGLDGTVDEAQVLTAALADIEAPHVQVLAALRTRADANAAAAEADRRNRGELLTMSRDDLLVELPGHRDVLDAVLRTLEGHYLVVPVSLGMTFETWGGPGQWGITDLGRSCLKRIGETAEPTGT